MKYKQISNSLYYGVSKCGEVVRLPHTRTNNINNVTYTSKLKVLKTSVNNSKGYERIRIKYQDGTEIKESVHRLVAKTYISNPLNLPQVNHIDGNKLNNCVDNLEWCSNNYNQKHAALYLNKRVNTKGEKHHSNKLSTQQVKALATEIKSGVSYTVLSKKYGVSKSLLSELKAGRTWRHLNLFPLKPRKSEKYFKKSRYVPTTRET